MEKQNNIKIYVRSATHKCTITPEEHTASYHSALAKSWANKLNGTVDGSEYSAKHYAKCSEDYSTESKNARDSILGNTNFQTISGDFAETHYIQTCADNILSIQSASTNAQIAQTNANLAQQQAQLAEQKLQECNAAVQNSANTGLSNLTENGLKTIRDNAYPGMEILDIGTSFYVDESENKRLNLNGQIILQEQYPHLTAKLNSLKNIKPGIFCTETEWQAESNSDSSGTCKKFVIDNDSETIRLPKYPNHFIQINEGIEEAERPINNYTVAVPYSYGMSLYYRGNMNNACFLKSASQWNDGSIYTGIYNWALTQLNSGIEGFKNVNNETITDYDWVIDSTNEQFKFPLKNGQEGMFLNIETTSITVNENNSSQITIPEEWHLYFYIGNVEQNAQLVNIGKLQEEIVNHKANTHLVETYQQGTSWYRIWSDGWCEQGGYFGTKGGTGWRAQTVTLLKPYPTVENYKVEALGNYYADSANSSSTNISAKSTTNFTVRYACNTDVQLPVWRAYGYISITE